jgi:cytoskeletal protein CcmA (bactofilin family)
MSKNNGSMFGFNGAAASRNNSANDANQRPAVRTVLGPGCRVEGKLVCTGPTRLDGSVEGELVADEFLLIDKNSSVIADLNVRELVVRGKVKGNICVTKRVALSENADVEGDIFTPSITISDGAKFKGRVEVNFDDQSAAAETSAAHGDKMNPERVGAVIREFTRPAEENGKKNPASA